MNREKERLKAQHASGCDQTRISQLAFNYGWNAAIKLMTKELRELNRAYQLVSRHPLNTAEPHPEYDRDRRAFEQLLKKKLKGDE